MKNRLLPCTLLYIISPLLWAESEPKDLNIQVATPKLAQTRLAQSLSPVETEEKIQAVSEADLLANPELARRLLNQVISNNQLELVPELLIIYRKTPEPDQILIDYAYAVILQSERKFSLSISLLRNIIAKNPNYLPVRFRLAQVLFEDRQDEAAADQFRKIQGENPPDYITKMIEQYLSAIQQRGGWRVNFGANYLRESNVNSASSSPVIRVGNVVFSKDPDSLPQKAHGVSYHLNLEKTWNIAGSHYVLLENDFYDKNYWDNHPYDDINNRSALGYQYQNAQSRFSLTPFYERRWVGGHRYNKGYGLRLEFDHWINAKWQISLASEWEKLRYRPDNIRLNGNTWLESATLVYLLNAKTYFYVGVDYLRENTLDRSLSSNRYTGRLGWGQEWWAGISSRLQVSYGKRDFLDKNGIFQQQRQDKELNINATLWHRNLHFWGITPKISYHHQRINSNLTDLYQSRKNRFYLLFEKTF
ncbi:surface lipoprotein assembly modifier [Lonepinella sp. BR2357]|uniref:surface lipoprotein assembly modifier n=1 Tax=Lonepinella sp. BR2357 TaxID=3434549 RepID=UPI003F6DDB63